MVSMSVCRYVGMSVCLSYVKLSAQAELRGPCACSKSFLVGKDCDTRVIDFDFVLCMIKIMIVWCTECYNIELIGLLLPMRASEQGNVIGLVSVYKYYIYVIKKIVIERTRDLNYLKFVATDFSPKTISPSAGENSGDLGGFHK